MFVDGLFVDFSSDTSLDLCLDFIFDAGIDVEILCGFVNPADELADGTDNSELEPVA